VVSGTGGVPLTTAIRAKAQGGPEFQWRQIESLIA
jgi:hypothetical protein